MKLVGNEVLSLLIRIAGRSEKKMVYVLKRVVGLRYQVNNIRWSYRAHGDVAPFVRDDWLRHMNLWPKVLMHSSDEGVSLRVVSKVLIVADSTFIICVLVL